uniref:heparosan-N-sulfate-glucuronate 5-epimerase n=1 Tax=Lissachatina fulica TaxID=2315439 RepID=A0A0C6EX43_LISFU|nr:heparosan glucuronate 5-epimerase [Lissachatina fulica]
MHLTCVRRAFRKVNWLLRSVVLLLTGGCLTILVNWQWPNSRPYYWLRSDAEFAGQFVSTADSSQLFEDQTVSCPPCPSIDDFPQSAQTLDLQIINCSINEAETIECRQDKGEVYMPVSFINNYFEVFGDVKRDGTSKLYNFQHAYGKIHPPQPVYHPGGVFLNFEKYNVAAREKILCVTASDGVPLAKQWDPAGYYYAISVAQYGLSHHAKGILEGNPTPRLMAGGQVEESRWENTGPEMEVNIAETTVDGEMMRVLSFSAPESYTAPGPVLRLSTQEQTICFDLQLTGPGGVTVQIKTRNGRTGYIHFILDDRYMEVNGSHVLYGIGTKNLGKWVHLTRDIFVDWMKTLHNAQFSSPTQFKEIVDVTLHGTGYLDNLTLSTSAHNDHLIHAANWLVNNQDSAGGWPTSIGMKTGENIELKPGWYSAMGQGQAMSTLVRAYNLTAHKYYLDTAVRALHLYELGSDVGGVRARFLGQLDWYEEYPTTPTSTFVLNGFIFAMLGLYDVMKTADGEGQRVAEKLWMSGLHSLKVMLGMYDSGTGTLYDLRHIINHEQPNRARWDYHTTHIALIQEMAIIDGDPLFDTTAKRWIDYFYGKRSKHN